MTKLYQKLIKRCPSETEIKKGLRAVESLSSSTPDKRLLMNLLNCVDLTSLNVTDNRSSILQLTGKVNGFSGRFSNIPNVAAICVYPNFVQVVKEKLTVKNVKIASVAGAFPSSQSFRILKISECKMAVEDGADEIDIVFPVGSFMGKDYESVAEEILEIKDAIGDKTLKVIIESGVLSNNELIFKASMIAMDAGADFIKTSTGKAPVSATPEAAYVMCQAILNFYSETGIQVGFKAAGGISDTSDARIYYNIARHCLGDEWMTNRLFRIGSSRLANNLLADLSGERNDHF